MFLILSIIGIWSDWGKGWMTVLIILSVLETSNSSK